MSDIKKVSLKKLSHRSWSTLRDLWIEHLPAIDFEVAYPGPTLWELNISFPTVGTDGTAICDQAPGVREAIFREAVLLSRKFIYCGALLPVLSQVGRTTWTAMTAYDAVFYAAKSFCYLLGFVSLGRDSKLYLDAFHETEQKVGKQKKKVYIFRIHRLEERLTHQALWALTQRLINTTEFEDDLQILQTKLKIVDWDEFTKFRNKVHYDGGYWPLHDDMNECDLTRVVALALEAPLETPAIPPFAADYFRVATMLRELLTGMLQTIADIAPGLTVEIDAYSALQVPQLSIDVAEI